MPKFSFDHGRTEGQEHVLSCAFAAKNLKFQIIKRILDFLSFVQTQQDGR